MVTETRLGTLLVDSTQSIVAREWQRLQKEIEQLREENERMREAVCWLLKWGVFVREVENEPEFSSICELVDFDYWEDEG